MYGAIFGDIIGSRFEFDRAGWTKEFTLFTRADSYTDDTVMTIAVAEALMRAGKDAEPDVIREKVIRSMRKWGRKYPRAGYGGRFHGWLFGRENAGPYGSYGNGSAMRVSAAGWLYDSLERTREVARATADVTHNHPEGIKGAECTAAVIYMARNAYTKTEIREYVEREFGYDLSESLEQMRRRHKHVETCQDSLPKALKSFLKGESYEDAVRNAVSLGGDTDTIAAIAGSMAEAFYGIPVKIMACGKEYLPEDVTEVLEAFDKVLERPVQDDLSSLYENNLAIKREVDNLSGCELSCEPRELFRVLLGRMQEEGVAPTPMVDVNKVTGSIDIENLRVGDKVKFDQDVRLRFDTMIDREGNEWLPLFTDMDEVNKGETSQILMNVSIRAILESGLTSERACGVVINPFGRAVVLDKEMLGRLLNK